MNYEAEVGVLSALITLEDFAGLIPFKLSEDDFHSIANKTVAKVLLSIIESGQQPNENLIKATAKALSIDDWDEHTNKNELIKSIISLEPSKEEAITYLRQLKKESIKNLAKKELKNLNSYISDTEDSLSDILSKFEDTILSITSSSDFTENKAIKLSNIVNETIDFYGENPGNIGLDIGMPNWQERIGGICNGKVHVVIATHKAGKSNIGMNAAFSVAKHIPVLIIDTEMDESTILTRTFSILTKVPTKIIENGNWKNIEHDDYKFFNRIQQGKEEYKQLNISYLSARGRTITDVIPYIRKWVIENKASAINGRFPQGLIIYDYIKLTSFEDLRRYGLEEWQLLGLNMSALKDFCGKYRVPCITFGQTNREDDSSIKCLGASKRIADLADSVSLFKAKDPELLTKDPNGSHLIKVFIARSGPATNFDEHIQVDYDKYTGIMKELGIFKYQQQQQDKFNKKSKTKHTVSADELLESVLGNEND